MSRLCLWLDAVLIVLGLCLLFWICRIYGLDPGDDF